MKPAAAQSRLASVAAIVATATLAYWGLYAVVAPVTNIDAQEYNLARVVLAWRGGLFENGLFTSVFHVIWPWSFDAAHLPFVLLGWGYALPSYFCLLGTCLVAWLMLRAAYDAGAAWLGVLSLLGLTCLVFQGTSTKNDIPVVLAGAVWIYARWRWRTEARDGHLAWMVLAIGFMAGCKTTGLAYGLILTLWTLGECIRAKKAALLRPTCLGFLLSFLLWGSVETYLESTRLFGHPLGPPNVIALHHADGNLATRMNSVGLYLGISVWDLNVPDLLRPASLPLPPRTVGHAWSPLLSPEYEEYCGNGLVGLLALATMVVACVRWRVKSVWWQLAAGAVACFLLVSLGIRYTTSGNRYLLPAFALGAVATLCGVWEVSRHRLSPLRWIYGCIVALAAVTAPFVCFNRSPSALIACIQDREAIETSGYPLIGKVREKLRELRAATPDAQVYFVVGHDSIVLPLLEDKDLGVTLLTPPTFSRLLAEGRLAPGDLVVADYLTDFRSLTQVDQVSAPAVSVFSQPGQQTKDIYRVRGPADPTR